MAWIPSGTDPGMGYLACMAVQVFSSCTIAIGIHSATSADISTNSGGRLLFCHILASICCVHGDTYSEWKLSSFCSHFPVSRDIDNFPKNN